MSRPGMKFMVEVPEPGQDAITDKRDWHAPNFRTRCPSTIVSVHCYHLNHRRRWSLTANRQIPIATSNDFSNAGSGRTS